jgi:hypothetical protein
VESSKASKFAKKNQKAGPANKATMMRGSKGAPASGLWDYDDGDDDQDGGSNRSGSQACLKEVPYAAAATALPLPGPAPPRPWDYHNEDNASGSEASELYSAEPELGLQAAAKKVILAAVKKQRKR